MKPWRSITIFQPEPTKLIISVSRSNRLYGAVVLIGAAVVWYGAVFKDSVSGWNSFQQRLTRITTDSPHLWIFLILPLLGVPYVWRQLRLAVKGREWVFDRIAGTMRWDNQETPMGQINNVKLATDIVDGSEVHHLSVDLQAGDSVYIGNSVDYNYLKEMADSLAKFVGKPIRLPE